MNNLYSMNYLLTLSLVVSSFLNTHLRNEDNGITFLEKGHWQDQYELSLQLFDAACKCALVIGDIVSLRLLSEQIRVYAKSFDDQLNSIYHTVTALCYTSQLPKAVEIMTLTLSQLGESFPETYTESEVKLYVEKTDSMLRRFSSDNDLIEYKLMEDSQKEMAMKFYARLLIPIVMIKPDALPILTMKMVQLSIIHGMSPISPLGFTYFGLILARLGDIHEGCRYVRIGKRMLDKMGSKEVAGELIGVATEVLTFLEPLQSTLESHVDGSNVAMAAGDVHSAILNKTFYVALSFWSGLSLSECRDRYAEAHRLIVEHNHYTHLSFMSGHGNIIARLTGMEDASVFDHQSMRAVRDTNPRSLFVFHFQQMYIQFMFREFDGTMEIAEKYFENNAVNWHLLYFVANQAFYASLVACWVYRETGESIWAERSRKRLFDMKKWADQNAWNFRHKAYLMEAEEAFCNNDTDAAERLYGKAICLARKHR